ncbi:hypothetical protein BKA70DRAFT_1424067 [Coprinopsis sp. MPI-PUGE-AT-0042]|nr:hypothetical protein BKA70DRAFT_1424067 [Coprinopsis sp. MPI-PUGE-AT-0042]
MALLLPTAPTSLWRYHLKLFPLHGDIPPPLTTWASLVPQPAPDPLKQAFSSLDSLEKALASGVAAGKDLAPFQAVILYLLREQGLEIPHELFPNVPRRISAPTPKEFNEASVFIACYVLLDAYLYSENCMSATSIARSPRLGWERAFATKNREKIVPAFKDWVAWSRLAHDGLETFHARAGLAGLGATPEERLASCLVHYSNTETSSRGAHFWGNLMAASASAMMVFREELGSTEESLKMAANNRLHPPPATAHMIDGQNSAAGAIAEGTTAQDLVPMDGPGEALGAADQLEGDWTVIPRALQFGTLFSPLALTANISLAKLGPKASDMMKAGHGLGTLRHPDLRQLEVGIQVFVVRMAFGLKPLETSVPDLLSCVKTAARSSASPAERQCFLPSSIPHNNLLALPSFTNVGMIAGPSHYPQTRHASVVPYLMDEAEIPRDKRYSYEDRDNEDGDSDTIGQDSRPTKRPRLDGSPLGEGQGTMEVDVGPARNAMYHDSMRRPQVREEEEEEEELEQANQPVTQIPGNEEDTQPSITYNDHMQVDLAKPDDGKRGGEEQEEEDNDDEPRGELPFHVDEQVDKPPVEEEEHRFSTPADKEQRVENPSATTQQRTVDKHPMEEEEEEEAEAEEPISKIPVNAEKRVEDLSATARREDEQARTVDKPPAEEEMVDEQARTVDIPPVEEETVEEQERIVDIRRQDGEEMVDEQARTVDKPPVEEEMVGEQKRTVDICRQDGEEMVDERVRTVDKPPVEEEMVVEQERTVDIRRQDGEEMVDEQAQTVDKPPVEEEMVDEQERMVDIRPQDGEDHHKCDNETCPICSGPISEVEGGTGKGTTGGGEKPPKKPKGSKGKKKKKKRASADPDDDSGSDFTVAHMKPRGGRGDKGKNKQVLANADEESGGGSPVARSQAASPIPGINDIHLSLSDNVSDTETAFGFRRIVKGRFRQPHVDQWSTRVWYNRVFVERWLEGLQGVEVVPSCPDVGETLEPERKIRCVGSGRLEVWKTSGPPVQLRPCYYHESDRDDILHYVKSVMKSYVDGIPRHIACKIDLPSSMKVFSFSQWDTMSLASQSDLFSCFHILLYDCPHIRGGLFDEKTLGRFVHLDRQTTMTGMPSSSLKCHLSQEDTDRSLDPAAGDKTRQVSADMNTILNQQFNQDSPRILNAIGTLLPPSPAEFEAHNLCDAAFDATQGSMGPGPSPSTPSGKDWLLVSNPWSLHGPHVDEGGGGTVVDTHVGGKLWMMLVPKWPNEGNGTPVTPKPEDYWRLFGQTRFWEAVADGDDGIKELNNCHWEGVLLPPRSRLFMRANTVHRVVTVEHSIVKGGHFFNRGTLMETLLNNIVCLFGGRSFTNTEHPGMRIYIHRIIIFHYEYYCLGRQHHHFKHHLLDPTKADDMAQLQALLMLGILEDVFNPRSYELGRANAKRETNGEDLIGREPPRAVYASYIKGISWTIVQWLTSCYSFSTTVIEGEERRPLTIDRFKEEYWYTMVGMQLAALHTWRVHLVEKGVVGSVHDHAADEIAANTKTLLQELALVAERHPKIHEVYQEHLQTPGDHLSPLVKLSWASMKWQAMQVKTYFEEREGWQIVRAGTNSKDMPILDKSCHGPFQLPPYSDD